MLLHTALALPTTVLITAAIFVGVPRDHEEAARIFGCAPLQAFIRVVAAAWRCRASRPPRSSPS